MLMKQKDTPCVKRFVNNQMKKSEQQTEELL